MIRGAAIADPRAKADEQTTIVEKEPAGCYACVDFDIEHEKRPKYRNARGKQSDPLCCLSARRAVEQPGLNPDGPYDAPVHE